MVRLGIDVGSTTVKIAACDDNGRIVHKDYRRHNAMSRQTLADMLRNMRESIGEDVSVRARITGSVGMGIAEMSGITFVQEVVAAAYAIRQRHPDATSMIDIGGEDAKVVFFRNGEAGDLRMNGNCAGGTGAFIDQMAIILGTDVDHLNSLALEAKNIYPIASRCGVFCKTDIQNLIAKNVSREDIAASIFHAVAVQTVVTLAHGCEIKAPVILCGGPLTFIPALRNAFTSYLNIADDGAIIPDDGALLPAIGAAIYDKSVATEGKLTDIIHKIEHPSKSLTERGVKLAPVFTGEDDYRQWQERIQTSAIRQSELRKGVNDVYIGIDSGSTTTKIVVTDDNNDILYSYYSPNAGSPIETVSKGLMELKSRCDAVGASLRICGCCSTGYGEDLVKAAFQLDHGIVETMAHYIAAAHLDPQVSFILDIGGQDMKAIFVNNGVINRIEINEACSSGCGSFIETFAKTLGYTAGEFSQKACKAVQPCDLGTRCTVFMNSKVKQVLRENATIDDIAAGLAYSVVKNCLYKVLKLKDTASLGEHIVVQGGTMRNDAVVRALELLTGREVTRCNYPELMGALGCAIYAKRHAATSPHTLDNILSQAIYTSRFLHCKGCDNQCLVVKYVFAGGKSFYSGNRCERVFTNGSKGKTKGVNAYTRKLELLFGTDVTAESHKETAQQAATASSTATSTTAKSHRLTIGIPRCLNIFEDYPFWKTLFTECGIDVCLSAPSKFASYERNARMVMSDNICFPAKVAHSHIQYLLDRKVDRVFMPFVVYERPTKEHNSYNCPVVSGYGEVVKGVQGKDSEGSQCQIPIDTPTISFRDDALLLQQCIDYLKPLGIDSKTIKAAFAKATAAQDAFGKALAKVNDDILNTSRCEGKLTIMLAGRPYHSDPLIQHKVSDMMSDMGINVITDDIVRGKDISINGEAHFLAQWSYPNRILKAALWCARQGSDVQFVQMTSFGCGPDAFLLDEVRDLLARYGKVLTQLKLDDINNIGSMKLRVRSLVESLRLQGEKHGDESPEAFRTTPIFDEECRKRKIIVPFFTPFISPLIPAVMSLEGYDLECLPMSDAQSCDCGLEFANNEVCYPATLVVGDIVKAFRNGTYDPAHTAVAMTQTGGQCRASNYLSLIKRALVNAGYGNVPVIAFAVGGDIKNNQPGFRVNWLKLLPVAMRAILYSDAIAKLFYPTVVREKHKGDAIRLKDKYLGEAAQMIRRGESKHLYKLLGEAAAAFNDACEDKECPRVGIVGEIFLKFNPFAQKDVTGWLVEQGVEIVPPVLADFFLQEFVSRKHNERTHLQNKSKAGFIYDAFYAMVRSNVKKVNKMASRFRYFTPFHEIFAESREARKVMSLSAQFGEGWLLPAEIMTYAHTGVPNVVCLQPFGCIANHIVSKGIERRVKKYYPDLNMLSLDFDSGVSDVNITNRLLLFIDKLKTAQ